MTEGEPAADAPRGARRRGRKAGVRYSAALGKRLCERVAAGELLYALCREDGMPTTQSVRVWLRTHPDFGAAMAEARRDSGRPAGGGVWSYDQATADEVFRRLCEGESLTRIGDDPAMPCLSTLFYWRRRIPAFEDAVQLAMRVRAERVCDLGLELAAEATPETAYLTHVRLTHLRWAAGVMAPRVYRLKGVEPEGAPVVTKVLMRRFEIEDDPVTGKPVVVAYCPNPETGAVEREDDPGWVRPDGVMLPGGGGV